MTPLTALVLAGTRAGGDPLAEHAGVSHKALIEVGGRTMIERVVEALAASPAVGRIVVAMFHPAAALHQQSLRQTVIDDFTHAIPAALAEAARMEPPKPGDDDDDAPPEQLSLF